ncbi:unnamed protein product [Agarophyton chilense]
MVLDSPPNTVKDTQNHLEQYASLLGQQNTPLTPSLIPPQHTPRLHNAIQELNKNKDALHTSRGGRGRSRTTAKQTTNNPEAISEEILNAMKALDNLPQQAVDKDQQYTYTLDSAAHPSNIAHNTSDVTDLPLPLTTSTAAPSPLQTRKKGTVRMIIDTGTSIKLPTFINKDIQSNLLSVRSIAKRLGPVIFTPQSAYILSQTVPIKLLGTASWNNNSYTLNLQHPTGADKLTQSQTSQTFIPLHHKKPQNLPAPLTTTRKGPLTRRSTPSSRPTFKPTPLAFTQTHDP